MTEPQWRAHWDAARMFPTAHGETGKAGGNETIRIDVAGQLRIKMPAALTDQFGSHLQIAAPVRFTQHGDEWAERVAGRIVPHGPGCPRKFPEVAGNAGAAIANAKVVNLSALSLLGR
jgi:hypothetical protein